jgi:hypothetical protein
MAYYQVYYILYCSNHFMLVSGLAYSLKPEDGGNMLLRNVC